MAFTIDPATELNRAFSARASGAIVGLTTKALSPGLKVRLAAAFKKIAGMLEKQARDEIGLTDENNTATDAGVLFHLVAKSEDWVIKPDVAAQLLPRKKYPQAWRTSKSGGNVTTEVGPLAEE